MAAGPDTSTSGKRNALSPRLERLLGSAGRLLLWERLWRALTPPLCVVALFVAASFLGLWDRIEPVWRPAGLALFVIALLVSAWPLTRLRSANRAERLARVDRDGAGAHRPATALDDELALGGRDSETKELWALHRARAAAAIEAIRLAPPSPGLPTRDPWAFRVAVVLLTALSAFVAGSDWSGRLGAAFAWTAPPAPETLARIDGWIDPPGYTRVPPMMLDLTGAQPRRDVKAPVGSTVVVRAPGGDVQVAVTGALAEVKPEATPEEKPDAAPPKPAAVPAVKDSGERRWKLGGAPATLVVRRAGREIARLALDSIPDRAPTIQISEAPDRSTRGTLTLAFRTDDDYGVVAGEAEFTVPKSTAPGAKAPRPLVEPPKAALTLPTTPGGVGDGKTAVDLATHPFAGARVLMTLTVKDEADQAGRSEAINVVLPQRIFTKSIARALVEQRRILSMDAEAKPMVLEAIHALMIAPALFTPEVPHFLGLKYIANGLMSARDDDALREIADFMWEMALRIEDGDMNQVERDLRAAEEALRQALENNASPEEIRRLTQELRAALDRYLRELAEQMRRDQRQNEAENRPNEQNQRQPNSRDMRSLMDRMDEANRRGDREEAKRLLEELQDMMDGLRTARPRELSPQAREMMRSIEELERMIREQQGLRDETFRNEQNRRADRNRQRPGDNAQPRQPGQRQPGQRNRQQPPGEGGDDEEAEENQQPQDGRPRTGRPRPGQGEGMDEKSLAERQKQLREQLEALKKRMQGNGMRGEEGLDEAEDAMREAERGLGEGRDGDAVGQQGRALEALRRGAQGLAQQMQPGPGGNEFGDGEPGEGMDDQGRPFGPRNRAAEREDPLGRPNRTRDWQDHRGHVPKAGETPLQRAQRVMEELRRRLSDPSRAQEELDYLRRLLSPY